MYLIAAISREPPLSLLEWIRAAETSPDLALLPPKEIINPFTGKPDWIHPEGEFEIVVDGRLRGVIAPSAYFDDDGEIDIRLIDDENIPSEVLAVINKLVSVLSAEIEWYNTAEADTEAD